MHPTGLIDMKTLCDSLGVNRFPHRRKACHLALVSVRAKAESARRGAICMTETVDRWRQREALIAAVDRLDLAVVKMTMAVINRVTATIRGHEQGVVPFGIKDGWQRVRQMVVVEMDNSVVAQPVIPPHRCHIEEVLCMRSIGAPCFTGHRAQLFALHMSPPLFTQPAPTAEMEKILHRKIGTADREHVDIAQRGADDAERLLDRKMGITAVTLHAGQAFKLNSRLHFVVNQHRGARVMGTVVNGENELLWHC